MSGETVRSHTPDDQPKARLLARTEEGSVFLMPNGDLGFIAPDCTDELEPQIRALPEPGGCGQGERVVVVGRALAEAADLVFDQESQGDGLSQADPQPPAQI